METKERYFHPVYFLTFLLFLPLLFLFPEEAKPLRIFLVGGIIIGAGVAYISRNQLYSFRRFATLAVSLLILAGTVYFVLKSTFLYREVIVICIKSLSLLIVANSFSSCLQGYLNSMQIFSILLFFCICALTKGYSNLFFILATGFVFNLLTVTRIKFYILFNNSKQTRGEHQGISAFFIIALVLSALLAWVLFMNLPLGKIKAWEYLKDEDGGSMEEQEKEKGASLPEEQIQKELTKLTFKLSSTDEMHRMLAAIQDLLIKEKPFAYEANKAQKDILEIIKNPILAQDVAKTKELRDSIKAYAGKKILNNLTRIRAGINNVIEDNRIGLRQRFAILSSVNKLEYSNSLEGIDKYSEQLQTVVNDVSIPDKTRKQLKQFNKQLKEWKAYQVYSKKFDSFKGKIDTLDENKKQDFNSLAQQISDANTVSDSIMAGKLIERMRQTSFLEDDKLINEAEEILKLKKIMLASKESSLLRKKLEDSGHPVDKPPELEDVLNAIEESRNPQEILKKISKLLERMREDSYFQIPREVKDMLGAKIESMIKESVDALKKQIQESNLPDSGESLLEGLRAMDLERTKDKITSVAEAMQSSLETFYKQGSITKETKDNLIKETKKIKQLFIVRLDLANMDKQEKPSDKDSPLGYQEKVANLLQDLSLDNEQKERIKKLMDKLEEAKTISQVEDVLEAINQELDVLTKKDNTKDLEKIKELIRQAAEEKKMFVVEKDSYDLREKIEDLKNVLPRQAALLEKNLDKIRESKTNQDLLNSASALKDLSETRQFEKQFKIDESLEVFENAEQQERLKIDLLPGYIVLPFKSNVSLKSVAIYDNFVKEIAPELEWFSSNPSVAFVNQLGLVYAKGIGEAEITCRYRGTVSRKCKVTVVETISDPELALIKNELEI
ncbi:MAG: hypothetical protein KKH57_04300 [Candidatus Omnitrophica bacterium]|nr:hypothetical protein [Candidatus Omnitrophota bacterium]